MTTQADEIRAAHLSPDGARPVLRNEAVGGSLASLPMTVSSGGELSGCGAEAAHLPTPATDLYRKGMDWPVERCGADTLLRCGERVDVVLMPSGLGGEVNHALKLLSLSAAVLEIGDVSRQWAFLCQSQPASITNLGVLPLYGVTHIGNGSLFALPPSPTSHGTGLRWVCPPTPGVTVLPMLATISMSARMAVLR